MIALVKTIGLLARSDRSVAIIQDGAVIDVSARAYLNGVREGMSTLEAQLVDNALEMIRYRDENFEEERDRFLELCADIAPRVRVIDRKCALIDSGTGYFVDDSFKRLGEIAHTVVVGVGVNELVAGIAADILGRRCSDVGKTGVHIKEIPQRDTAEFLENMPVTELWPLDGETVTRLMQLGLQRIGQVRRVSPEELVAVFGEKGKTIWEMVNGRYSSGAVTAVFPNLQFEFEFGGDTDDGVILRRGLAKIAGQAKRELMKLNCGFKRIELSLVLASGCEITSLKRFKSVRSGDSVGYILDSMLTGLKLPCAVSRASVKISGLVSTMPEQLGLLQRPAAKVRRGIGPQILISTAGQLVSRREQMLRYWDPMRRPRWDGHELSEG